MVGPTNGAYNGALSEGMEHLVCVAALFTWKLQTVSHACNYPTMVFDSLSKGRFLEKKRPIARRSWAKYLAFF